jgi:S-DNA-T family DNA segregation ATPase FtsK/SpoIIIE
VFALGRRRGQQVAFPLGSSSLGATFHRVVERLHALGAGTVAGAVGGFLDHLPSTASTGAVEAAIARFLLDLLADEIEVSPVLATMPAEVDDLADALRAFAAYVASELSRFGGPPAEALARFCHAAELEVEASVDVRGPDGELRTVCLGGRLDAVHARADGLDVVEYKLTGEDNERLDRAQVALYRWLVRSAQGLDARPVVLRFSPGLVRTELPPAEADRLVADELFPLLAHMSAWVDGTAPAPAPARTDLCAVCPVRAACIEEYPQPLACRDEPPSSATRPRPDALGRIVEARRSRAVDLGIAAPGDEAGREEAARVAGLVVEGFRRQHVAVEAEPPVVGARLLRVELRAVRGAVRALDRTVEDVRHWLRTEHGVDAHFVREGGMRAVDVARRVPRRVGLSALLQREAAWLAERPGRFVLGETLRGEVFRGDFSDPVSCHLLIGGSSGSGKSVLLKALAASLVHVHQPSRLRLTLVDPKRVTFGSMRAALGTHLAQPVISDVEEAVALVERLVDEMNERYRLFEEAGVEDLDHFDQEGPAQARPCRHVVLIDEFADLLADRRLAGPFLDGIVRLGAKARAAGIHLVLATQRPDAKTVPGPLKTNLVGKIALRVPNAVASRVILGRAGAEALLGNGDMLADLGHGAVRVQGAIVD